MKKKETEYKLKKKNKTQKKICAVTTRVRKSRAARSLRDRKKKHETNWFQLENEN